MLALAPNDEEARAAVRALELLARPTARIEARGARDDQPASLAEGALSASMGLDPLTFLDAEVSGLRLTSDVLAESVTLGAARAGLRARLPGGALTVAASAGLRAGDGGRRTFLYRASLETPLGSGATLRLEVNRDVALDSALSYRARVPVTSAALSLRAARGQSQGAIEARGLSYGDGNAGVSAFAWGLFPLAATAGVSLRGGGAVAWRDSRESRFRLESVTSHRSGTVFTYDYRGVFDPYVTPERQLEARLLGEGSAQLGTRLSFRAHGEWGLGRERATGFGPASGFAPLPTSVASASFPRTYHPWRAAAEVELKLEASSFSAGVSRSSGAFYRVTAFAASYWRRF